MTGSVRRVQNAVRLLLAVQRRSGFLHIYFGLALVTVVIVRLLLPREWHDLAVPILLLGEYGTLGVFMVAGHYYLERIEGSNAALVVTPLTPREQVAARLLAPGLVGTLAGILVHAGILGFDRRVALLVLPLFLTTLLAGAVGLILSSYTTEFTRFLLGLIPLMMVFSLPYLSFFELTPRYLFAWLPWDAALFSFANLAQPEPEALTFFTGVTYLSLFVVAGFWWAEQRFKSRARQLGETV